MAVPSSTTPVSALDLTRVAPRSPRETLGGYVIAARTLDRCRALIAGTLGPYKYNGGMDKVFFEFTGIDAEDFKAYVATGASDTEVDTWIRKQVKQANPTEVVIWNNKMRDLEFKDLPPDRQVYLEEYVAEFIPAGRIIYRWFDMYDIEEGRL